MKKYITSQIKTKIKVPHTYKGPFKNKGSKLMWHIEVRQKGPYTLRMSMALGGKKNHVSYPNDIRATLGKENLTFIALRLTKMAHIGW